MKFKLSIAALSLLATSVLVISCGQGNRQTSYAKGSRPYGLDSNRRHGLAKTNVMATYEFKNPGCTTGIQRFESAPKLCKALKDKKINNDCAENERRSKFLAECKGDWSVTDLGISVAPTSLTCKGVLKNAKERTDIDKTIRWDGKDNATIVLLSNDESKNKGEYSVGFNLPKASGDVATYELVGSNIDVVKTVKFSGSVKTKSGLFVVETLPRGVSLELSCGPHGTSELALSTKPTFHCEGDVTTKDGASHGKIDETIAWETVQVAKNPLPVQKINESGALDGTRLTEKEMASIYLTLKPHHDNLLKMELSSENLDGHINVKSVSTGHSVSFHFASSEDKSQYSVRCQMVD